MSDETLKNIIRKSMLHARGFVSYAFQGGEPLLRGIDFFEKAMALQKKYNRRGIRVQNALQTNGFAVDEAWCQFFADHHFLVGISIDGIKEVHDAYRHDRQGGGTFERIVQATEMMDAYGVDYNILTVVHQKTVEHVDEIYREYRNRGWNYQQYIACLDPLDEGHQKTEYAISPEQYGKFLTRLFELWYRDWKRNRQPYIRQFENYIAMLLGYPPEACDQGGCCSIQYVVEADGGAYPCDFYMLDAYRLGSFNENTLAQLDERRKEIGFLERSHKLDSKCTVCPYYVLCRAGCQRHRDPVKQTTYYRNYFCEGYKLFFGQCKDKMVEIARTLK